MRITYSFPCRRCNSPVALHHRNSSKLPHIWGAFLILQFLQVWKLSLVNSWLHDLWTKRWNQHVFSEMMLIPCDIFLRRNLIRLGSSLIINSSMQMEWLVNSNQNQYHAVEWSRRPELSSCSACNRCWLLHHANIGRNYCNYLPRSWKFEGESNYWQCRQIRIN